MTMNDTVQVTEGSYLRVEQIERETYGTSLMRRRFIDKKSTEYRYSLSSVILFFYR